MSSSDQIVLQCNQCEYKSNYQSNMTRHKKNVHGVEAPTKQLSREKIMAFVDNKPVDQPKPADHHEIEEEIELDEYINDKVNQILKQNNMPPVKVPRDVMKGLFSGTVPTFLAGSIMGWILSQVLPPFFFSIKQNHPAFHKKLNMMPPPLMPTSSPESTTKPEGLPLEPLA